MEMSGLNLMDKVLMVRGATIALTIWDVAGIYTSFIFTTSNSIRLLLGLYIFMFN